MLMKSKIKRLALATLLLLSLIVPSSALALQNPQNGSIGLEGTIGGAAPSQAATITTPSNGASFSNQPITVNGICPTGLLIKLFDNNVFVGSAVCTNGSFSLQIDLFEGQDSLVARDYDALGRNGPDSNTVNVTFTGGQFTAFGSQLTLTSTYAEEGVNPGQSLSWPIVLSGGIGPYAISVDWGDGSTASLLSQAFEGNFNITHTYQSAGSYTVIVRATDKNGSTAFLQLVAIANGQSTSQSNSQTKQTIVVTRVVWWPCLVLLVFLPIAFWLGRRYENYSLRRRIEQSSEPPD